jgi:hypothetical protein
MGHRIPRSILLLALAALLAAPAFGQTAPATGSDASIWDDWEFAVTPYLWLFNLKGDIGTHGRKADVDTSLIDLFQNNDSVIDIEANLQARNGPWTVLVDPTFLRVQDDAHFEVGPLSADADVTADVYLIDLMVMRELWHVPFGAPVIEKGMPRHGFTLDAVGGGRVWVLDMDANLDVSTPGPIFDNLNRAFNKTENWIDPVIGGRASIDLTERIHLLLRGDIGGFHAGSDLTSELWGNIVLDFGLLGHKAFAALGYRGLYVDYDHNDFLLKAWLHGPTIGVGMKF